MVATPYWDSGQILKLVFQVFCEKLVRKLFGHTYSSHNRYLAACQETNGNITQRMNELRLTWSWNLADV